MSPKRVQRRRTKGWRMPEGAVYVGRPTRWGNPFAVGDDVQVSGVMVGPGSGFFDPHDVRGFDMPGLLLGADIAVQLFRADLLLSLDEVTDEPSTMDLRRALLQLRGRDLACWCPLDAPCHADVLLELANA